MIQRLYAIKDQLSTFKAPFIMVNDRVAEREFKAIVNDQRSGLYYAPNYFDLFYVGDFDDETGKIISKESVLICNGSAVMEKKDV